MAYTVLQLTDTHLFGSENNLLFGIDANKKFLEIIEFLKKNEIHFDCIFLTGDISQDETYESYELIADTLSLFEKEIYWIHGNHDDVKKMDEVFRKYPFFKKVDHCMVEKFGWNFIFVDSVLPGKDSGFVKQEALEKLKRQIGATPKDLSIALVMHHHPIPVGTPLIDNFILQNGDDLLKAIKNSAASTIMCGHVHGQYDIIKDNIRLISSPASCLQFKKGSSELLVEDVGGLTLWKFSKNMCFSYENYFI